MIDMIETPAQRDAERIREHAPKLLASLAAIIDADDAHALDQRLIEQGRLAREYATGAHDPECYAIPETGYEVDAAGTALG